MYPVHTPRIHQNPVSPPTPAGWLVDDSSSFNPYWLAYSEKNQAFVDTYRARGKRVVTMWAAPGDAAAAYEAMRLKVAELERGLSDAAIVDGAMAYERHLDGARPGSQREAMRAAVRVMGFRVVEDSSVAPGTMRFQP
ncbi:hypothetical protein [Bradyrhizobium sp. 613_E4_N2_2]|uniref:hypothetical protein n=1 Tax=Bradyrhizobium sp. 613_E4_N2_2 TaxID=3240371 RepID=UPI003F8BC94B